VAVSRQRRFRSKSALGVAVVACACLILAVGAVVRSHGSGGSASPAASARPWEQNLRSIGRRYAECLRKHGHPQIADPSVTSDGRVSFGAQEEAVNAASRALRGTTCRRELAAIKDAPPKPPTPAQLRRAVLFSQCIRQHGVPDWPDPHPDGTYPLNQPLQRAGKGGVLAALEPCRHLNPGAGIQLSPSSQSTAKKT
jgi:hypothetical protein